MFTGVRQNQFLFKAVCTDSVLIHDGFVQDLDETLSERLWGLTEMFPETMQKVFGSVLGLSFSVAKASYSLGRSALWIAASSATIMVLPIVFESERAQQQEQQLQQQRQVSTLFQDAYEREREHLHDFQLFTLNKSR